MNYELRTLNLCPDVYRDVFVLYQRDINDKPLTNFMEQLLKEIFDSHEADKNQQQSLISLLQKIQNKLGYIPEEAVERMSEFLRISKSKIFGVASFYSQFRFTRPAEHSVKVCLGTACHVRGGQHIFDFLENELKITPDGVTSDGRFGLERVACVGCCALSPVVVIDGKVYGKTTPLKIKSEIKKLER